jgi:hypothetical protein
MRRLRRWLVFGFSALVVFFPSAGSAQAPYQQGKQSPSLPGAVREVWQT